MFGLGHGHAVDGKQDGAYGEIDYFPPGVDNVYAHGVEHSGKRGIKAEPAQMIGYGIAASSDKIRGCHHHRVASERGPCAAHVAHRGNEESVHGEGHGQAKE